MVYFHPWEIDPEQPGIRGARRSILRHYTNLSTMEGKIERLLHDFRFASLSDVCRRHHGFHVRPPAVNADTPRAAAVVAAGASNTSR
jgi:hypothetical protein